MGVAVLGGLLGGASKKTVAKRKQGNKSKSRKKKRSPAASAPADASRPGGAGPRDQMRVCIVRRHACVTDCRDRDGDRRVCRNECAREFDECVERCRRTPRRCRIDDDCDDRDSCTRDVCNLDTRQCEFPIVAGCCTTDDQCSDDNVCTRDTCDLATNTCGNQPIAGCCTDDAECATANPCSVDTCDLATNTCVHTAIEGCCRGDGDCATCQHCSSENRCVADSSQEGATCQASDADGACCQGVCIACDPGQSVDPSTCACAADGGAACTAEQQAICPHCCPDPDRAVGFYCLLSDEVQCEATCPSQGGCTCLTDGDCSGEYPEYHCCHCSGEPVGFCQIELCGCGT